MTLEFFYLKKSKLKYVHLNVSNNNMITYRFRIPLRIEEDEWDTEKQRPKNIYLKKYRKINSKIDRLKVVLKEHAESMRKKGRPISYKGINNEIQRICKEKESIYSENSLLHFIKLYISGRKEMICHSTYKRYMVFFRLLQRFEGFMMQNFLIEDVNSDFVKHFISFGKEEDYSNNTIYRSIHFVKTILNFAERRGIRTYVREIEVRREKQHKEIITLTEQEIVQIKVTEIPEELQPAKDWLLISCYTGQRISDFMNFSIEHLTEVNGKTCIGFTQQKTGKEMLLPLHPDVIGVVRRNGGVFPSPINPHLYNEQIRKIGKLAGLNRIINTGKRIGFRTKHMLIEKWQVLSSHIGRRSFATNFYGKIPTPLLMEATGHSTEHMFLKYINHKDKERILSLSQHFERVCEDRMRDIL